MTLESTKIGIVPGVSMLAVLSNLNYKPWFALAEYVDNAVQSSIDNASALRRLHGADYRLRVEITVDSGDGGTIIVRDNAYGISRIDFPRAFRPASPPDNRAGLSEFGMGMKSASCWFAPSWQVETTSVGDELRYRIDFDVDSIVKEQKEELDVYSFPSNPEDHYTTITLRNVYHLPVKKTIGKIKRHLTDIYRVMIRSGQLQLSFNGDPLHYDLPEILTAPDYREPDSTPLEWKKDIDFEFGDGLKVRGFAALRETGSTSNTGFSLFRRGRVIEGSGEDGYRPAAIFGGGNTYRSQRLFGELHLSGFGVSHTKDGFKWGENEEGFLHRLRVELERPPLSLLKQAEGFRKLDRRRGRAQEIAEALESTSRSIEQYLPLALPLIDGSVELLTPDSSDVEDSDCHVRSLGFELDGQRWDIRLTVAPSGSSRWIHRTISADSKKEIAIALQVNANHPFVVQFGQKDAESLEVLLRLAAALVVAEVISRQADVKQAGVVLSNINEVLTRALSGPRIGE